MKRTAVAVVVTVLTARKTTRTHLSRLSSAMRQQGVRENKIHSLKAKDSLLPLPILLVLLVLLVLRNGMILHNGMLETCEDLEDNQNDKYWKPEGISTWTLSKALRPAC